MTYNCLTCDKPFEDVQLLRIHIVKQCYTKKNQFDKRIVNQPKIKKRGDEKIKGFHTNVCRECGNVAQIVPHLDKSRPQGHKTCLTDEAKEPCVVCGAFEWRSVVLNE